MRNLLATKPLFELAHPGRRGCTFPASDVPAGAVRTLDAVYDWAQVRAQRLAVSAPLPPHIRQVGGTAVRAEVRGQLKGDPVPRARASHASALISRSVARGDLCEVTARSARCCHERPARARSSLRVQCATCAVG